MGRITTSGFEQLFRKMAAHSKPEPELPKGFIKRLAEAYRVIDGQYSHRASRARFRKMHIGRTWRNTRG